MSLSGTLTHLDWHDRKINFIDCPGDAGFQADSYAALRVVEGVLVVLSGVMGVEVNSLRVWKRAEEYELSRVVFVNMLDRERADFFRVLEAARDAALRPLRRHPAADRRRARDDRRRRPAAHVRVHGSVRRQGGRRAADSRGDGRAGAGVPREAPRRRRRDERGADGALPRRRGAAGRGRRRRAQGCGDARRAVPGGVRGRDEEPRYDGAPRPARRGRPVTRAQGHDDRVRRCEAGGVHLQDDRRPVRGPHQLLPRPRRSGDGRHDARRPAHACKGTARPDPPAAGEGQRAERGAVCRRPRRSRRS